MQGRARGLSRMLLGLVLLLLFTVLLVGGVYLAVEAPKGRRPALIAAVLTFLGLMVLWVALGFLLRQAMQS